MQKKPRVFFTEEQKMSLRQAYANDAYPNQNTLEELAKDLGVGTKTVINWFHNHRMRAKQQHGGGGTPGTAHSSSNGSGGQLSAKAELQSNQSDDDDGGGGGASSPSDMETCDDARSPWKSDPTTAAMSSQCLFPSFVAVNGDDGLRVASGAARTSSHLPNSRSSVDDSAVDDSIADITADSCSSNDGSSSKLNSSLSSPADEVEPFDAAAAAKECFAETVPPSSSTTPGDAKEKQCVNKRKSARPQWLYEGIVLDRSLHGSIGSLTAGQKLCLNPKAAEDGVETGSQERDDDGDDEEIIDPTNEAGQLDDGYKTSSSPDGAKGYRIVGENRQNSAITATGKDETMPDDVGRADEIARNVERRKHDTYTRTDADNLPNSVNRQDYQRTASDTARFVGSRLDRECVDGWEF